MGEPVRVFISHHHADKRAAGKLSVALAERYIEGFVAHEDISINDDWNERIREELTRADALVAILGKRFNESQWTDQEVGWALGRGIPTVSLYRSGCAPHGFLNKRQGIRYDGTKAEELGGHVLDALLKETRIARKVASALVRGLKNSESYEESKRVASFLFEVPSFTKAQLSGIEDAIKCNAQVRDADYEKLPKTLRPLVSRHRRRRRR